MVSIQHTKQIQKILYFDHVPYEGGAEVSLKELVENLDRTRIDTVIVAPEKAPYVIELREADIRCVFFTFHWKWYWTIGVLIWDLVRLIRLIKREVPNIIHNNTRVTNILGGFLNSLKIFLPSEIKIINHVRDKDPLPKWKTKLIEKCDQIIANSNQVKEFLVSGGIKSEKIAVIYNGVDLSRFDKTKYDPFDESRPILTFIGQIYPRKGLDFLVRALGKVRGEFPDVILKIVGKDPTSEQKYLSEYTNICKELNLTENVVWLGYLDYHTKIPALLANTDVFILPSLEEPFGRVLIDAMAMGVPVVATEVGGIPEIVINEKTGFLVPPADEVALIEKILLLLKDQSLREKFGKEGRQRVEEEFSLTKHVQEIEKLYNKFT